MAGGGTEISLNQVLERAKEVSELMVNSYSKAGGHRAIEKINDDRLDTLQINRKMAHSEWVLNILPTLRGVVKGIVVIWLHG